MAVGLEKESEDATAKPIPSLTPQPNNNVKLREEKQEAVDKKERKTSLLYRQLFINAIK